MSLTHSPSIKDTNLVMHIDSFNSRCYQSGSIINDLSNNSNNLTIGGGSYSNKAFKYAGIGGSSFSFLNNANFNDYFGGSFTLIIICKPTRFGGELTNCNNYFGTLWSKQGNNANTNWIYVGHTCGFYGTGGNPDSSTGAFSWQAFGNHNSTSYSGTNLILSVSNIIKDETIHLAFQFIRSGENFSLKAYKNGVYQTQTSTKTFTDVPLGEFRLGGRNNNCSSNGFVGDVYLTSLYNTELSEIEIKNHFNAFRGRFGI